MSKGDDLPEPDCIEGALHPRETPVLFGHAKAEDSFLTAYNSGRLHHGWLLTGPRGVGKATLAYRIARFLIATPADDGGMFAPQPPSSLDIAEDHPVAHRVRARAEPALAVIRRSPNPTTGKMRDVISVDDIRALGHFLSMSAADGGRRVVIVDAADEMNVSAANALLKMLEEPPARTTLLLIAHQPAGLLPTIRSRCRELRLAPLGADDMNRALSQAGVEAPSHALATLSSGSVGAAMELSNLDGLALYAEITALMGSLPGLDRQAALRLSETAAARGASERFGLMISLFDIFLSRLTRAGALQSAPSPEAAPNEAAIMQRLAPNAHAARVWAEAAGEISARARHGQAVNLDPAALVLDTAFKLQTCAQKIL